MATCTTPFMSRSDRHMSRIRGAGIQNFTTEFVFSFDAFTKRQPPAAPVETEDIDCPSAKRRKVQDVPENVRDTTSTQPSDKSASNLITAVATQDDASKKVTRTKSFRKQKPDAALVEPIQDDAQSTKQQAISNEPKPQTTIKVAKQKSSKQTKQKAPASPRKSPPKRSARAPPNTNSALHELDHNTILHRSKSKSNKPSKQAKPRPQAALATQTEKPTQASTRPQQSSKPRRKALQTPEHNTTSSTNKTSTQDENVDWLFETTEANPSTKVIATRSKTRSKKATAASKRKHEEDVDLDDLLCQVATFAK